ncbi:MAG: isoprenylcysteine carboxylmethyltransferase family protein [Gemmatimonadaceae bacterium]
MAADADTAGVVAPPPLIYLAAIVAGAVLERVWRWRIPTARWGAVLGALLIGAAIVLLAWAVREFARTQTSPKPHEPTTAIVTSGPFGFTRNPIYIAFTLVQLGVGLWAASGWILAMVIPALIVIRYGVVAREERYLERKFGEDYASYRRTVRRWV